MFKTLKEDKVIRDPIHEYIRIDLEIIWKTIATKEFQRLRRIRQLGATFQVYPTGEHSRFSHSLGVYEIVRRMVNENDDIRNNLTDYEKVCVMLAGLLHDIGHGPFSHSFESISKINHEKYTLAIILGGSEVNEVLKTADPRLPETVAKIIDHSHPNKLLTQMISSQLDADRMDYLLRDSYFTGTSYGKFDLERILRTIRVENKVLVVKESGIHSIEDYLMARYHMYWQVYLHPISRSFEAVLESLFKRFYDLAQTNPEVRARYPMFESLLLKNSPDIEDLFYLDENACYYGFSLMSQDSDFILRDLSQRILHRRLFDYGDVKNLFVYEELLKKANYNLEYYLKIDKTKQKPYEPYRQDSSDAIWILCEEDIKEISEVSEIVKAISAGKDKEQELVYYPKGENNE